MISKVVLLLGVSRLSTGQYTSAAAWVLFRMLLRDVDIWACSPVAAYSRLFRFAVAFRVLHMYQIDYFRHFVLGRVTKCCNAHQRQ